MVIIKQVVAPEFEENLKKMVPGVVLRHKKNYSLPKGLSEERFVLRTTGRLARNRPPRENPAHGGSPSTEEVILHSS